MSSNKTTIDTMRKALSECTTDWKVNGNVPPDFIRETGLGEEVARVDVRCGGFQNSHDPVMIGWKARCGSSYQSGTLLVSDFPDSPATGQSAKDFAVIQAKADADEALEELRGREGN